MVYVLVYIPLMRPYVDLLWWQYTFLSLPFANLILGVVVGMIAGLTIRSHTWKRTVHFYYLIVALALLTFNLVLIL